jgi:peroxiredoxin
MKQYIFLAVTILSLACKSENKPTTQNDGALPSGKLVIKGEIAGLDNGFVEILNVTNPMNKRPDSTIVENGKFMYTTELAEPTQMAIRKAGTQGEELVFFADPGDVLIKGDKDSIWKATITAGNTQALFVASQDSIKKIMAPGKALYEAYTAAQTRQDNMEMDRIQQEYVGLQEKVQQFVVRFAKAHGNSVLAAYLGSTYLQEQGKEDQLLQVYSALTAGVKSSWFGKRIGETITAIEGIALGTVAADITLPDVNDKPVSISSYRGKYLLIDFWASWCGPCRQENPNVVKAYAIYHPKGLEILGISLDKTKESWLQAIQEDKLGWTHVSDLKYWDSEAARLYGVQAIPTNFLLDKEGKIIAKNLRGPELEQKLASLMP